MVFEVVDLCDQVNQLHDDVNDRDDSRCDDDALQNGDDCHIGGDVGKDECFGHSQKNTEEEEHHDEDNVDGDNLAEATRSRRIHQSEKSFNLCKDRSQIGLKLVWCLGNFVEN